MNFRESAQACLEEAEHIEKLVQICEDQETDYVSGLLAFNSLDPDDVKYDPIYMIHEILVKEAEMSPREALTLIDNAIYSFFEGLLKLSDEGEEAEM